ncbi:MULTISPECIES: sigma-70 family RNA polymerase sigma factor [Roseiflexus]|jgi:RNA polymerase sigma-70 factor (ECF subfamily)|uniref:RNA polymerase, sigma-24 subunit, ECF subfamily n=1 Tax=Roseiflexus castenholzii (strain DSM 13941 / HLO8) TaxID=383372 RepID=A7NI00_ROSCS|nr:MULTISPECIES: sigma-70 family RNA polymerase sigma factor [Roseiflexus]ABU57097.1 RNA polymerase, sigma-24 subunit, ECF subfamily [Roseiflexus castenholzii DSM 13941]PMP88582.1 MAG: RNA polymerase subunit sigma-24 [Roseiflexus castenholzii]GIV99924.1 MAG: DNA-directed RNA polymerase sigma-70 factor [Roseiflexus sp.]
MDASPADSDFPLSDSDLIKRAQDGDHAAFAQIYDRYAQPLYRYIYFRIGDPDLAEDLRAEVFLRAFEGLDRYEDRGWPLSAWLYRIARDRTVDVIRRRRLRQTVPLESWGGACEGPDHEVVMRLDHEELRRHLCDLTDDQRQVLYLRFMVDLPIQEVAQRLGRSEGAVKALQHRGLQSLARRLAL